MYTLAAADTLQGLAGTASAITYSIFGMELSSASGVEVYKKLAQGQLTGSPVTIYTTPGLTTAFIKNIVLCNTIPSMVSGVLLYASGSAAGNQLVSISIPANGQAIIDDYGVKVYDAGGSLQLGGGALFDATLPAAIAPGTAGAVGTAATAARRDHVHAGSGGIASLTTTSAAISTTETQVLAATIAANSMKAGTTYRITVGGTSTQTSASVGNLRVRLGPNGNNSDNIPAVLAPTAATSGTASAFYAEFVLTVQTAGTSGTVVGGGFLHVPNTTSIANVLYVVNQVTVAVAVNTTVQNTIQLTFQSGNAANSATFYVCVIEVVKA